MWSGCALLLVVAAALRLQAARDEFWFDEVWSLTQFANKATSALQILSLHHDNNHHLNTLWMYVCGQRDAWIVYRIPSMLAGIGTVALAMLWARPWGRASTIAAGILTGGSFVLIQYSSEARGYALAGFFLLAALLTLQRRLAGGAAWTLLAFWCAVILGFLSHLTFASGYLGLAAWSAVELWRRVPNKMQALLEWARCHVVPIVFLAAFYWFEVRHFVIGKAPPYELTDVLAETLGLSVGVVGWSAAIMVVAGLLGTVAAIAALVLLWREKSNLWVFFVVTIYVAPALLLAVRRPEVLFPRYFFMGLLTLPLLWSVLVGWLWRQGTPARVGGAVFVALLVAANTLQTSELLAVGRGHYLEAIQYIVGNDPGPRVLVRSDHDFRNRLLIDFYRGYVEGGDRLEYYYSDVSTNGTADWGILHGNGPRFKPLPSVEDPHGNRYDLQKVFPAAGLSGSSWAVYRRAGAMSPGPTR